MSRTEQTGSSLASTALSDLEQVVARFEEGWQQGQQPAIDDFLPASETVRRAVLIELIHVDLERRLKAGEPARVESYLQRYPDLAADREAFLGLIVAEYRLRWRGEPGFTPDEYQRRFPDHSEELATRLREQVLRQPQTPFPTTSVTTPAQAGLPQVAGYEVEGELGRGGMGVVYKARQKGLNRTVALKMIRSGRHADAEDLARFCREAEAVARLQHPHIVQVYEIGDHDGLPYFSLEYVEGGSLEHRLAGAPLPPSQAAALVETLARAVHCAHERGIVHRDLKPANILLAHDPTRRAGGSSTQHPSATAAGSGHPPGEAPVAAQFPKIADFGLAKRLEEAQGQTQSGDILGTPAYMAPEQASGRAAAVGPQADVYALGAILYETLTGRPPFRGATVLDTLDQVRRQEPVAPSRLNPKVPRDLETVCLKCLQKDPGRRYASAQDLADDLGRFREGKPVSARPVGTGERLWRWCRRNPALASASALALALLLVGTVVSSTFAFFLNVTNDDLEDKNQKLEVEKQEKQKNLVEVQRQKRQIEGETARLLLDRALTLCAQGEVGPGLVWLARALELASEEDEDLLRVLRLNVDAWRRQLYPLRCCLPHPGTVRAAAFSPDGRLVLTGGEDGTARLWDAASGEPAGTPLRHDGPVLAVAFSPDSRLLVTGSADKTARLWDAATGLPHGSILRHDGAVTAVAISYDSARVATGGGDNAAHLWDTVTGQSLAVLAHEGPVHTVSFSPDGNRLATGGDDKAARLWDANGKAIGSPLVHPDPVLEATFSSDSKLLLTRGRTARLWDAATGRALAALQKGDPLSKVEEVPVYAATFSPDSQTVTASGLERRILRWQTPGLQMIYLPFGLVSVTSAYPKELTALVYSPDGRTILTGSGGHSTRPGEARLSPYLKPAGPALPHPHGVHAVAFSPDGRAILTLDGTVRLWQAARLPDSRLRLAADERVLLAALSPDGRTALTRSNGQVNLWNATTGARIAILPVNPFEVFRAVFSPDGKTLFTGGSSFPLKPGRGGDVRLWEVATGRVVGQPLTPTGGLHALVFSPDGRRVLTCSGNFNPLQGEARLWDAATGKPATDPLAHPGPVLAGAFSPDGQLVLTASQDGTASLWDVRTGQRVGPALGHPAAVLQVGWARDGKWFFTRAADDAVRLWDVAGQPVGEPIRQAQLSSAALSPDGTQLLTGSRERKAQLWDSRTGLPLGLELPQSAEVRTITFTGDGRAFLILSSQGWQLWDTATRRPIGPVATLGNTSDVQFSADGRRFVSFDGNPLNQSSLGAELWELPEAGLAATRQLACELQLLTNLRVEGEAVQVLEADEWHQRRGLLQELGGKTVEHDWSDDQVRDWHLRQLQDFRASAVPFNPGLPSSLPPDSASHAALWHLGRLLAARPDDPALRGQRARLFRGLGQWDQAVADYNALLESRPGDTAALAQRGWGLARQGKWDRALEDFTRALEKYPRSGPLWLRRHFAHAQLGQWDRAEEAFARALELAGVVSLGPTAGELHPDTKEVPVLETTDHLAGSFWDRDNLAPWSGREEANQWAALADDSSELLGHGAADWWLVRGRGLALATIASRQFTLTPSEGWRLAAADLSRAATLKPDDSEVHRLLGCVYARLAQWDQAVQSFSRLVDRRPDDWWPRRARGWAYLQARQYDKAVADFSAALERQGDEVLLLRERARAHAALRQPEKAVEDLTRALDRRPGNWELLAARGLVHADRGASAEALADLSRALDLLTDQPAQRVGGDYPYLFFVRGTLLVRAGNWDRAADDFARVTELRPATLAMWRAHVLLRLRSGKPAGYREWCAQLLSETALQPGLDFASALPADWIFADPALQAAVPGSSPRTNPSAAVNALAGILVLAPDALPEPTALVRLMEQTVAQEPKNPVYLTTLGAALHRADRAEAAVQRLQEACAVQGKDSSPRTWLFLALAHQRLGHGEEARRWLDRATHSLEAAATPPWIGKAPAPLAWDELLELQILQREAQAASPAAGP